jgi:hypothetical protein
VNGPLLKSFRQFIDCTLKHSLACRRAGLQLGRAVLGQTGSVAGDAEFGHLRLKVGLFQGIS